MNSCKELDLEICVGHSFFARVYVEEQNRSSTCAIRHLVPIIPNLSIPSLGTIISNKLLEGTIDRRANFGTFVEVYSGDSAFADTLRSKFEFLSPLAMNQRQGYHAFAYLVNVLVWATCAKSIETELLMGISLPTQC